MPRLAFIGIAGRLLKAYVEILCIGMVGDLHAASRTTTSYAFYSASAHNLTTFELFADRVLVNVFSADRADYRFWHGSEV